MTDPAPSFPQICSEVQQRYATAGADREEPELPFRLATADGASFDPVTTLLVGALAIALAIATAITLVFTSGIVLQVLAGLCLLANVVWLWRVLKGKRLGAQWRHEAKPYPAALVMAHHSVHEPGNSVVPGCLLVDFGATPDPRRMVDAAREAFALTEAPAASPTTAPVREWLEAGMRRAQFGRIRLPRELAGNDTCWLVSLRLDRKMMPVGHVDRSLWFVKARPDRNESAELLPHQYWTDAG